MHSGWPSSMRGWPHIRFSSVQTMGGAQMNDTQTWGWISWPMMRSSGFRLHSLEVFNWGTFDGRVWT